MMIGKMMMKIGKMMMNNKQTIQIDKTKAIYLLEAIEFYTKNSATNGVAQKCLNEIAAQLKNIN